MQQQLLGGLKLRLLPPLAFIGCHLLLQRVGELNQIAELVPVLLDNPIAMINTSCLVAEHDGGEFVAEVLPLLLHGETVNVGFLGNHL